MDALIWAVGAAFVVSLLSFVGVLTLALKKASFKKILLKMVAFSAGALMGGALLHLLPEAVEESAGSTIFLTVLIGFSVFFIIERFLYWHHCHKYGKCKVHMFTYMNLLGDGIHNFTDGIIIAASFIINIPFGIVTTIAIIAHEIPQELGDFGVLVYGGFKRAKALFFNFLFALTAVIGAVAGYFLSSISEGLHIYLLPFAAGGFIYIAASDLVPELHKEPDLKKSALSFLFFLLGILFMFCTKLVFE